MPKGVRITEKLNIVGKRSGNGFVAHKATLVNALGRALAERVMLLDFTVGRKGLLGYLKAIAGSNVVKIVPTNGSASETQAIGKRLKVVCGSNTSYLEDMAWVGEKTPLTLCDVRVSPNNAVKPNIGSLELAEALLRVLPFTAKDDARPVLNCVKFEAKEGKLNLVSADGFTLAVVTLDYEDGEGQALVNRSDLAGIANALRKARRARISFEASGESLDGMSLIIDTEAIRYKWRGADGTFPDYQKLIPTETNTVAHFDAVEALRAIGSLRVLADSKAYPINITLDNGYVVLANIEDKGQTAIAADIEGKPLMVRLDGSYLAQALKACGGMVDFRLTNAYSPTLFTVDGYQLVVMPMQTSETNETQKRDREARAEQAEPAKAEAVTPTEPQAEAEPSGEAEAVTDEPSDEVTEGEAEAEPEADKPKRSRKKEKVAVA